MKIKARLISKNLCSCPYCGITFEIIDELKTHVIAVHKTDPLPKPDGLLHLTVNGKRYEIMVEPEWTLYYLLHDKLGFTGTKLFCDRGVCGSCTVIIDSRPTLSCMTLAVECDDKTIETIEGIAASNHPLIEEYVSHHAMQCGYCTPGFIMASAGLLRKNPNPIPGSRP